MREPLDKRRLIQILVLLVLLIGLFAKSTYDYYTG